MGHPTMQENDTAKLTPTILNISFRKHGFSMIVFLIKHLKLVV